MTPVEERLSELMHEATRSMTGVSFDDVARRARHRRRSQLAAVAVAALAVIAAVTGIALALAGRNGQDVQRVTTTPTPTPTISGPSVTFQGLAFVLPVGWKQALPACYPVNRTVTIGDWPGSCPASPLRFQLTTTVHIDALYGPQFALGWAGQRTSFEGQPAWKYETHPVAGETEVTLALPWANAVVRTRSPDPATARALLEQIRLSTAAGLDVPRQASTVFIQSLAGRDGDPLVRNATVFASSDVRKLLADLRTLPAIGSRQACDATWFPDSALLTVQSSQGSRTYAAQFGPCSQVIAGTGTAAEATHQLLIDIRRLVPNSGL